MTETEDLISIKLSDLREGSLVAVDLERILKDNDVGDLVHTPSNELWKNFDGNTTWFTPFAPNPHLLVRPELFPDLTEIVWYRNREQSIANSSDPIIIGGAGSIDERGQILFSSS